MEKVKRRLTKVGRSRTMSNASGNKPSRRHRSISATVSSSAIPLVQDCDHTHQIQLCYLGFVTVDEPRSTKDISAAVRNVMATALNQKNVTITFDQGVLTVAEESGDQLILCSFQHVAIVTQDSSRNSYMENSSCCLVMGFHSGRYAKQCHVFQAKTNREVGGLFILNSALTRICHT